MSSVNASHLVANGGHKMTTREASEEMGSGGGGDVGSTEAGSISKLAAEWGCEPAVFREPPRFSTVRVNLLMTDVPSQEEALRGYLTERGSDCAVRRHPRLPELLVVEAPGRRALPDTGRHLLVDAACGAAVLRGADVYAPGVLACPADAQAGEAVSVVAVLDGGCLRGRTQPYHGRQMLVGNGVLQLSRRDIFTAEHPRGVAVRLTAPLFGAPSLGPFCGPLAFLQNLPSVAAARALAPQPGDLVLDMCAAPGGKTTHLAQMMRDTGRIIALDKTAPKVSRICSLAEQQNIRCVRALRADATRVIAADSGCRLREHHRSGAACPLHGAAPCTPPFPPGTFDSVLLDAPCSGLGQRPRLTPPPPAAQLASYPALQRRLLAVAADALRPGGALVYSTCTLPAAENERQVAALLTARPEMALVSAEPRLGGPGLPGHDLTEEQRQLVQRFTPELGGDSCDTDTIGFFIAKLVKRGGDS